MNWQDSARLGEFVAGESLLHRLDPRTKVIISLVFAGVLFAANSYTSLLTLAALAALACGLSRLPLAKIARALQPVMAMLVAVSILHLLASPEPYLAEIGPVKISQPGIAEAGLVVLRLGTLLVIAALISWTTAPMALAQALELLLAPLARLGLPVFELATMVGIALRFVPTLVAELQRLIKAQEARGVNFSNGSLLKRARAFMPLGIPLVVATMERSDELAMAMESRCFPGRKRTRFRELKMGALDRRALVSCSIIGVLILAIR